MRTNQYFLKTNATIRVVRDPGGIQWLRCFHLTSDEKTHTCQRLKTITKNVLYAKKAINI